MKLQKRPVTRFEIALVDKSFGKGSIKTVCLRDLHSKLKNGKQFADWIKLRIEQYGFVEGKDYVVFHSEVRNPSGGRPSEEYYGTLGMAKELAMVERNPIGKAARQYFIQCEEELQKRNPRVITEKLNLEELGLRLLQVGPEQRQKQTRNSFVNVLRNQIGCGNRWVRRLTNEIYKTLLDSSRATASNFRQHMNLPEVSAQFLTRDQLEGHIQSFVAAIEWNTLTLYSMSEDIEFGDLRSFALEQAKQYRKQLIKIMNGRTPSALVFEHSYNVVPILPYQRRALQCKTNVA